LSDVLAIDHESLPAEAYSGSESIVPVHLSFGGEVAEFDFVLYQNFPNPFDGSTAIPVQIPEEGQVLLQIHTSDGSLVYFEERMCEPGITRFDISSDDLSEYGVYYYTISTNRFTGTRKMIMLSR
jgi:hypothetical protein